MNNIKKRAIATVILVVLLTTGIITYSIRFFALGGSWAEFTGNGHLYSDGVLVSGTVYDRYGTMLAGVEDGKRVYNKSSSMRRAVLHIVGDKRGNIGTGVLSKFASELGGYSFLNGVYTRTGSGSDLYLTIDAGLCQTAYSAMNGRHGTVVVYNYENGEVLCMTSTPGIDPADPPDDDSLDPEDGVYINRAMSSTFTPGSVFKLITTEAALETVTGIHKKNFTCEGSSTVGGDRIKCTGTHGEIDIDDALGNSCNCAFAEIAELVGGNTLAKYVNKAGLTKTMSVNGIKTAKGSFEAGADGTANLAWSGIGQYNDLINPMTMLRYVGSIANGGTGVTPKIISRITTQSGIPAGFYSGSDSVSILNSDTAATLKKMMRYNVESHYGDDNFPGLKVCAKTGTAQVGTGKEDHAWFTGFLDDEKHPYAFIVLIENGGFGLSAAGSVANEVLQAAVD